MRRLCLLLFACLTAALLAGCGSDEPEAVDGDGYTFEAPDGWEDVTGDSEEIADLIGGSGGDAAGAAAADAYDVAVVSDETSNDFRTNFNVGLQEDVPPDYDSLRFAEQNIAVFENPDQVEGLLPEGIEVDFVGDEPRRIALGGETAYEVQYGLTTAEADLEALQVFAVHDDTAYVATYTADAEVFDPDSEDLRRILESWEWD